MDFYSGYIKAAVNDMIDYSGEANEKIVQFCIIVPLINSIVISICANKSLASKKLIFYREAASIYNTSAYFISITAACMMEMSLFYDVL